MTLFLFWVNLSYTNQMKYLLLFLISLNLLANADLLGEDKDQDGIRDDVNQWLVEKKGIYSSSIIKEFKTMYKRMIMVYKIKTPEEVNSYNKAVIYSKGCLVGLSGNNVTFAFTQYRKFQDLVFNTQERKAAFDKHNPDTSDLPFSDEKYLQITKSGNFSQACNYRVESDIKTVE